ncbi:hypothetical protein WMF45_37340 [Sorangium sp. So ce448]|uniref:hypothetical protein n=1 Tax=Sorangium sp. So ce448 TaxID=3133314 RepID=UPI003F645CEA
MARPHLLPFTLVSIAALAACDRSEPASAPASAGATATAAPAPSGASAAAPAASCPTGKWEYDYADMFLETLARSSSGARVVSERGKYICTFNGNERGSYVCETSEGGVENVFEAPTAGTALRITLKMNGRSSADYEPAGPGRWKTTRADMSGLRVETKATLGGRDMPVPATNAFSGMDRPGTLFEYRCEGDVFKLKPIVEGMATDFITMKRVP